MTMAKATETPINTTSVEPSCAIPPWEELGGVAVALTPLAAADFAIIDDEAVEAMRREFWRFADVALVCPEDKLEPVGTILLLLLALLATAFCPAFAVHCDDSWQE